MSDNLFDGTGVFPVPQTPGTSVEEYVIHYSLGMNQLNTEMRIELSYFNNRHDSDVKAYLRDYLSGTIKPSHTYTDPPIACIGQPSWLLVELHESLDWYFTPSQPGVRIRRGDKDKFRNLNHVTFAPSGSDPFTITPGKSPNTPGCRIIYLSIQQIPPKSLKGDYNPANLYPFNLNVMCNRTNSLPVALQIDPDIKNEGPPPPPIKLPPPLKPGNTTAKVRA